MKLNDDDLNLLEMIFMDSIECNLKFKDTKLEIQKLYIKICDESENKMGYLDAILNLQKKRGT